MTDEEKAIVERRQATVQAILRPEANQSVPVQAPAPKTRATRSDKGKTREGIFIQLPGVRLDLSEPLGRKALKRLLVSGFASADIEDAVFMVFDALLGHIDRLREQGK